VEVGFATVDHAGVHRPVTTQHVMSLAALPCEHSALLEGPVSVVLASRNPNGSSHLCPIWLGRDELYLYVATSGGLVVDRNLRARPTVSLLVVDPADPYRWMDVSAHAEPVGGGPDHCDAQRRELIDQLGQSTASHGPTTSVGDGPDDRIPALYRARPDRLTVFERSRPGSNLP
jgi:Pyridoxamine 5'-phosphate oxidase